MDWESLLTTVAAILVANVIMAFFNQAMQLVRRYMQERGPIPPTEETGPSWLNFRRRAMISSFFIGPLFYLMKLTLEPYDPIIWYDVLIAIIKLLHSFFSLFFALSLVGILFAKEVKDKISCVKLMLVAALAVSLVTGFTGYLERERDRVLLLTREAP